MKDVLGKMFTRKKSDLPPHARTIRGLEGKLSNEESLQLYELAKQTREGVILEVGSFRGKSTICLALGTRDGANLPVYAIEPHEEFVGPLGGVFGPPDRVAFFRQVLEAGCAETVRLVNLSSEVVAPGWTRPIGFLWIDGDHSLAATRRDAEAWLPHLMPGALVAFHDTLDEELGPFTVVAELQERGYALEGRLNSTALLRKPG